eukprot:6208122-Pleurochrysis_carterae.AAC.1
MPSATERDAPSPRTAGLSHQPSERDATPKLVYPQPKCGDAANNRSQNQKALASRLCLSSGILAVLAATIKEARNCVCKAKLTSTVANEGHVAKTAREKEGDMEAQCRPAGKELSNRSPSQETANVGEPRRLILNTHGLKGMRKRARTSDSETESESEQHERDRRRKSQAGPEELAGR